jgi:hypothetical protein
MPRQWRHAACRGTFREDVMSQILTAPCTVGDEPLPDRAALSRPVRFDGEGLFDLPMVPRSEAFAEDLVGAEPAYAPPRIGRAAATMFAASCSGAVLAALVLVFTLPA